LSLLYSSTGAAISRAASGILSSLRQHILQHARLAAAKQQLHISKDTAVKAALLACGIMELRPGQKLPVARYGISAM
jgi:hypothetical protein